MVRTVNSDDMAAPWLRLTRRVKKCGNEIFRDPRFPPSVPAFNQPVRRRRLQHRVVVGRRRAANRIIKASTNLSP